MYKIDVETIIKIIDALNGSVKPVGETNVDNKRFDNLKALEEIINCLLDDVQMLIPNRNRHEYSMKRAGDEAVGYLREVRSRIDFWTAALERMG